VSELYSRTGDRINRTCVRTQVPRPAIPLLRFGPVDPDFGLSGEERDLVGVARRWVGDRVTPSAASYEEKKEFPRELFRHLGEMGLAGIPYEERHGGGGQSYLLYLAVVEEVARGSLPLAVTVSVHHLCAFGIHEFGSDQLKERYLPRLFSGEWLGAYALSEASSGSDAAALRTRADRRDGGYVLNGSKRFITHAGEAEVYLVMARTGGQGPAGISAFVVEKGWDGFEFGKLEDKMGWNSSPMRELLFEGCRVPADNLVGEEGIGFRIALAALDGGRLGIAACSVGLAQAALDASISFTREREQFGRPVIENQAIQFMLADMATGIEAGRRLYREAARARDAGEGETVDASMAKLLASDTAMRVTTDAVQLHGGYGYMEEYPVERFMREAKALQIVEGTNQIQRVVIGRHLAGG
jgi:alkylation response protein AidB-like acyl-CoA dehydrogenase